MTWRLLATAVMLFVMVGPAHAQSLAAPALSDYAVLGVRNVIVGRGTRIPGGAVGAVQGTTVIAADTRVSNAVAAPRIRLGAGSDTGNLFCHLVSGPPPLPTCHAFTDPLVDPGLLAPVPVAPGVTDFRLQRHTGTAPLAAQAFRDVRIAPGSAMQLAGGDYTMRSLRIGRDARVVCASACRIGVAGTVRLAAGALLGAATPAEARTARVDVGAVGRAFVARRRANVSATIFAPAGTVVLGSLGSYRGAFVGGSVVVAPRTTIRGGSAL